MKTNSIIIVFALCGAMQAVAWGQSAGNFASTNVHGKTLQVANPFARAKAGDNIEGNKGEIKRFGRISSQPWTQTAGWHPDGPAAFIDAKSYGPTSSLLWIGAAPQP